MKRLRKKVVIGTTAGLASLILNACGVYGPEPADINGASDTTSQAINTTEGADANSTSNSAEAEANSATSEAAADTATTGEAASETSVAEESSSHISFTEVKPGDSSVLDAINGSSVDLGDYEYMDPKETPVPTVYGPPMSDR